MDRESGEHSPSVRRAMFIDRESGEHSSSLRRAMSQCCSWTTSAPHIPNNTWPSYGGQNAPTRFSIYKHGPPNGGHLTEGRKRRLR